MTNKKGITLIVLVITIIVIIILAGAVILSLNNTQVIENANESVRQNDAMQASSAIQLWIADLMITNQCNYTIEYSTSDGNFTAKPDISGVENAVKSKNDIAGLKDYDQAKISCDATGKVSIAK